MAGFQDAVSLVAAGEQMIVPINFDVLADLLQAGRAGIVPDTFLPGAGFYFSFHKDETDRGINGFNWFAVIYGGHESVFINIKAPCSPQTTRTYPAGLLTSVKDTRADCWSGDQRDTAC